MKRRGRSAFRRASCAVVFALAVALVLPLASPAAGVPVLLVYGFQPLQLWQTFAESWSGRSIAEAVRIELDSTHAFYIMPAVDAAHADVIVGNYANSFEPTVRSLRYYAVRLSDEVAWAISTLGVLQVDIVAHSMGSLIARCVIESADVGDGASPADSGSVRTLVTLATPHHGAELALVPLWIGPISDDLRPSSDVLTALDANGLNPRVRYVSMAGETCIGCGMSRDEAACLRECVVQALAWDGSDLVVSMESAWLSGAENTVCVGMNHIDMHCHPALADAVAAVLRGDPAPSVVFASDKLRAAAAFGP